MKVFHIDHFPVPLPEGHRFPIEKYALLRRRVAESGLIPPEQMQVPAAATADQLALAHDPEYIRRVLHGELTPQELRRIGFPWSPELAERACRSVGATIAACRAALADGIAVSLSGGTHHAGRAHGAGYCVFNDVAVAARVMQAEGRARRVVVIDCDVHQGDGTAAIFAGDPTVFTFSIHGAKNFPFRKEQSDLDVALPDGAGDSEYLAALAPALDHALAAARADLAIYLAGSDPYHDDKLGRMALTKAGLAERDRLVLARCRAAGLPTAVTMAGGYARDVRDTAEIHFQTVRLAAAAAAIR